MNNIYPHVIAPQEKRYKLIACEIMFREVCYLLSQTHKIVDVVFLEKGLHDIGEEKMRATIQKEIEKADPDKYEAVLLGYGLCNNGVRGLQSKVQMVIPRAHDCITLFIGSKERYKEYFNTNPGTYYKTLGWIEREMSGSQMDTIMDQLGLRMTYEDYVKEYGEENAQYLMETLGNWTENYTKMAFIDMSIHKEDGSIISFGDSDAHLLLTKQKAEELGWEFERIKGNIQLIEKLINGDWDNTEFQLIPPTHKIIATNSDEIVSFE